MRIVVYNILVALGYFLTWVLLDFHDIRTKGNDPLSEWGVYVLFTIPVAFFYANKGLFSQRTGGVRYSLVALIALLFSVVWFLVSVWPVVVIHFAMGGSD